MDLNLSGVYRVLALSCLFQIIYGIALHSSATQSAPIRVKSIEIAAAPSGYTNVTLAFRAMSIVQVVWTIDEGIKPEDLNPGTLTHNHLIKDGDSHVNILLPANLVFEKLILHLLCKMHSFELHLDMRIPQNVNNMIQSVEQYDLLVPNANEIGVTLRGETRFPVMVNTSGTTYTFGLLQADVTLLNGQKVKHDSAFSFLPNNPNQIINVNTIAENRNEHHLHIVIKDKDLNNGETLLNIMAACSHPNGIIERMDIKQGLLLKHGNSAISGFENSINIIDGQSENIQAQKGSQASLICKTVGVSNPTMKLYKKATTGMVPVNVPSYTTSLPYETTSVFQLLNVSESDTGTYLCAVTKDQLSASKIFTVNVVR